MQRSKWFALVFLIGAFVAGVAIGVAADRTIMHNRPGRHASRSPIDRMAHDLNLTVSQRAQFDTILEARRKQMRQLFAPIRPQMDSLMKIGERMGDSTHEQLRAILTPDQQVKFDKMHADAKKRGADARARWDSGKPGPGPGHEPGPELGPGEKR
jgi:Spy/CpxP family protein refolding chaperone